MTWDLIWINSMGNLGAVGVFPECRHSSCVSNVDAVLAPGHPQQQCYWITDDCISYWKDQGIKQFHVKATRSMNGVRVVKLTGWIILKFSTDIGNNIIPCWLTFQVKFKRSGILLNFYTPDCLLAGLIVGLGPANEGRRYKHRISSFWYQRDVRLQITGDTCFHSSQLHLFECE